MSVTTTSIRFEAGTLNSQRVGILLPLSRSEVRLEHVGPVDIYLDSQGKPTQLTGANGNCSFTLSEARVATARPGAGDEVRLEWREREPDWMHVRFSPARAATTSWNRSIVVESAGRITEVSGCTNGDRVGGKQIADVGPLEARCQGSCSYAYRRLPGEVVLETDVPLAKDSAIDFMRVSGGQTESGVIEPAGSLAIQANSPVPIHPGSHVYLSKVRSGVIKRLSVDKGFHVTLTGQFDRIESGPGDNLLTDHRPTYWSGIEADKVLGKYVSAVLVLGAAILSALTRLKFVQKE